MKSAIVPAAVSHGDRLARRAITFALEDVPVADAADRLCALASGDRSALVHAVERARSRSRIRKAGATESSNERAVRALALALELTDS